MGDSSIKVETSELNRFAEDVRFEAGDVLQPAVGRAKVSLNDGVRFGAKNASGAVHAAKQQYAEALSQSMANLNQFVEAAKIMAAAAEMVAADFDAVDMRSKDAAARINGVLRTATDQAAAARLAAQRADQRSSGGPYAI